jgi:hypothetical protein
VVEKVKDSCVLALWRKMTRRVPLWWSQSEKRLDRLVIWVLSEKVLKERKIGRKEDL